MELFDSEPESGGPEKRCVRCGRWLPRDQFHRNRRRRDGLQSYCRDCNIERNKRWYREHPEARPSRMDAQAKRRREEGQGRLLEYLLRHPCVDCGETDPVVLEFDHLRDKFLNVSAMITRKSRWELVMAEIEKCEVVCANCHRRRTARRALTFRWRHTRPPGEREGPDTLGSTGA